jgi:hypothetical protein
MRLAILSLLAFTAATFAAEPIGWRNDSTGIYPQTTPPLHWNRTSKTVNALRFQATPPTDDKPAGQPMPDGAIRDWLLLGPLDDAKDEKKKPTDPIFTQDLATLAPAPGDKAADTQWTKHTTDTTFIDFAKVYDAYGKKIKKAAYAASYVYSPDAANFLVSVNHTEDAFFFWVNGKLTHKPDEVVNYAPQTVKLKKGWNTILLRSKPSRGERPNPGTWYASVVFRAVPDKAEFEQTNIRWKTTISGSEGFGGPIAVKDKIFLQSEMADLVCVDAATGKILWLRSNNYDQVATDEEKKSHPEIFQELEPLQAKLKTINDSFATDNPPKLQEKDGRESYREKTDTERKIQSLMRKVDDKKYALPKGQDVGYAGFTPVSDGTHVFAWFATGVSCCYDLDGNLVWRRLDNEGSFFEHGYSTSPILADGKLIVFMNKLLAFDAKTGERVWTTDLTVLATMRFHGTPASFKIADTAYCVLPTGHVIRLSDGKMVRNKGPEISPRQQEIPSPVSLNNTIYSLSTYGIFTKAMLPKEPADPLLPASVEKLTVDVARYPTYYLDWFMASPLIHDGLAYCVNNAGVLTVFDLEKMTIVYQKFLDLDQLQAVHEGAGRGLGISPSLAGGNIYLVGNAGAVLIIKPGRTYQQLAKNKIESVIMRNWQNRTERFVAAPTFVGKRMFLRGDRFLYCIEE